MPELPDVYVFKEYLDSTSLHQRVEAAALESGELLSGTTKSELTARLEGNEFESTPVGQWVSCQ